ncbi:hypothetical protein EZ313_04880 [Ramlibacter henchirensis]|uniref:Uncharacterized protein n=1 Tax=Ramlibacter henchirensis TaxID=204072 RepID=A0A4Z0C6I7_9BURK|nr:hypothetical protein [Ramlibacter henchirensis]TFZ05988.1 hypothetical protein EZ313_04880 [Ramlibacter henchirensis]
MHKILPAIAVTLTLVLQPALADHLPAATAAESLPAGGIMQATLVVPAAAAAQRQTDQAPRATSTQTEDENATGKHAGRERTTGMLLAALALMAAIVLRRWSTDQR